jgi:hypothetical protein
LSASHTTRLPKQPALRSAPSEVGFTVAANNSGSC